MRKHLTVATPCYNEEGSLPSYFARIDELTARLNAKGWRVSYLLIDDGSEDGTPALLAAYAGARPEVAVVRHATNGGYGASIQTAMAYVVTDWLAFVDADSNYDQRLIAKLVDLAEQTPSVGIWNVSIFAPGGEVGYPWYRSMLSYSVSLMYKIAFPLLTRGIHTMTCGYRLYRADVIPVVLPRANNFYATTEIMLRALRARIVVCDVPAPNRRREHGISKMKFLRNILGHFGLILRARLHLLGPSGHLSPTEPSESQAAPRTT